MMKHNSSFNLRSIGGASVLFWGMGTIPGVAADQYCYTSINGLWTCTTRLPLGARIAICIGASILLSMILSLCLCLCMRNRRARNQEAIAAVYQIEASQIHGPPPPSTYVTSFDPRSPAGYPLPPSAYLHSPHNPPSSFPQTPDGYLHTPDADRLSARPPMSSARSGRVRFEPTAERYQGAFSTKQPPQTAPVNPPYKSPGAYPFPGYSSKPSALQQPHTAYSIGFPRPLYTGQPVQKDDEAKVREIV